MITNQVTRLQADRYEIKLVPGTDHDRHELLALSKEDIEFQYIQAVYTKLGIDYNLLEAEPILGKEFCVIGIVRRA